MALSAEAIDLGRSYWILHPISCHTPEAVTTVFKCSWGWTQIASETCRVLLQLIINILPSCITLVLYIYYIFVLFDISNMCINILTNECVWIWIYIRIQHKYFGWPYYLPSAGNMAKSVLFTSNCFAGALDKQLRLYNVVIYSYLWILLWLRISLWF
jgi:hypothetical protein